MPEGVSNGLARRRFEALDQIHMFLLNAAGVADRLGKSDLERFVPYSFTDGWRIPKGWCGDVERNLLVLVDRDFPYAPPRFAVEPPPEPLAWPHIEGNGLLCLLSSDASINTTDPIAVLQELLAEAHQLCKESTQGSNSEDFRSEFLSYWRIAVSNCKESPRVLSLLDPCGPSRQIAVLAHQGGVFVGEDRDVLQAWLQRRFGVTNDQTRNGVRDGMLMWLPQPLIPEQYPTTGLDLLALARESGPKTLNLLEDMAAESPSKLRVILGSTSNGNGCFASIECSNPPRERTGCRTRDPISKGFRPGRVPRRLLARRYLNPRVDLANVDRADHMWVHGRDGNNRQAELCKKRVACLGCGSVGGAVARLLAQAGVGSLVLVDPELLEWSNVGRHVLGARSVNQQKAAQVAMEIRSAFPHLNVVEFKPERIGPRAKSLMVDLKSCDLIVSMMGNWNAEIFLNDWQREDANAPPILYGWLERHAAAAHAVLVRSGQGCLRCGFDGCGRFDLEATSWPEDSHDSLEPACGAIFTPYGPVELCWAHALVARLALGVLVGSETASVHHTWLGATDHLRNAGGNWSKRWLDQVGDPSEGGRTIILSWPNSGECPTCQRPEPGPWQSPIRQAINA